jgi:hypothetical protein
MRLLPGVMLARVDAIPPRLTGHIRTWAEHDAVVDAARRGVGVKYVRDDLLVTG